MNTLLSYVWYPALSAAALAAYGLLLSLGMPAALAAYAPIGLVAIAILFLEARFPANHEWRARRSEVKTDAAYLVLVQIALPRILLLVTTLAIAGWTHEHSRSRLWPHAWPLASQILIMLLLIDFVRYWLHRACHRSAVLWKLHKVHHSPQILYALNVGRFHPLEKMMHFAVDTLPFLLLGTAPPVIAGYFLLYSVNGFFQHSNLQLRHGWLNYLVASAETHRWHHAVDPAIASCNFSNTSIVWDWVFGTRYLPRSIGVKEVGIQDRDYPRGIVAQFWAPFQDLKPDRMRCKARLVNAMLRLQLRKTLLLRAARLAVTLRNPMRAQRALLARILARNRDTAFGLRHRFRQMRTYEDFSNSVPVSDFEQLRPWVDAEIDDGSRALTHEPPMCYVRTSGTTGKPKDLPLTGTHLRSLRHIQQTSIAFQHRSCPEAFDGSILAITSPAHEGTLRNGRAFGSASGIVARSTQRLVLNKFVLPPAVATVLDSRVKYLLILRLALARADITYAATANPTTLLTLSRLYREHHAQLMQDLRQGTFFLADQLSPEVAAAIRTRLVPCPQRAAELIALHACRGELRIADLWPRLRLVTTWTFASAGIAVGALRQELLPGTRIFELGYIASEFRGTITLGRRPATGLPTLDAHFFEFVERDRWDRGDPEFLTLEQVRKGMVYYIVVTTPSGLYRYFINDLVRVSGFLHKTPLLKFVQKGKGVTNITGEKLYESQVLAAVRASMDDIGCTARFVMMLADDDLRGYRLYIETEEGARPDPMIMADKVDRALAELNVEYRSKRESRRLEFIEAHWLRCGSGEDYKRFCVRQGQREGQFKTLALAYQKDFGFDLQSRVERS